MPARGDAESRSKRSGNLASRLKFGTKLREAVLCFIAGLAVSIIFYPINFPFYSFIALIPILWISYFLGPGSFWKGYFFGFGHFVSCFAWLNEVFPGSSFGLALAYSFLTASWNFLTTRLLFNLDYGKLKDLAPKNAKEPLYPDTFTIGKVIFFCGLSAAIWVCMESVRSIIFTGLPWNQLGACLWAYPRLISIVSFTGIYGLSFIIVFVNLNLFLILRNIYLIKKKNHPERFFNKKQCLPLLILVALFVVPVHTWESSENIRVALIQGNIPLEQMYNSNPKKALENLKLSEETYKELTFMAADEKPDLIIWPETALPRALRPGEPLMREIFNRVECPMIIGTVRRELRDGTKGLLIDDYRQYNSAIYFDEAGRVIDKYSKIHIVPFGEYTPFKDLWPKKILKYIYM
ncbi:MAG: apolipoprotein N-acyltransferase, partial [Lentisphaeria bacterium]|nr:apolipoprotein N-acyltransferase [Lentisphaeria bacterium]NQZ68082.1 apolipoprotein N-acyltransferase [Lentisphaeria bacterium]